jgi:DNA-binding LytR/AlgR family response regulator
MPIDAFDLSACDYLLKPFSLDRFIIAVDKALEKINSAPVEQREDITAKTEDYAFIKADGKIYKVQFNDLLFAEAKGNYTRIVCTHILFCP